MKYINDMIESVKAMKLLNMKSKEPKLELITDKNDGERDIKNEERRTRYQADRKEYRARENAFENNKRYVYRKIIGICTDKMVDKIEREADFDSVLFNGPIELLKRIRKFMTITADT